MKEYYVHNQLCECGGMDFDFKLHRGVQYVEDNYAMTNGGKFYEIKCNKCKEKIKHLSFYGSCKNNKYRMFEHQYGYRICQNCMNEKNE